MSDPTGAFARSAARLAKNPLGIIALFIVMVYGLAALLTGFASQFTAAERTPLIYFLVLFPVLVLGVFGWLVSRHGNKLFSPGDFKDESNYIRALTASASLAVATVANGQTLSAAQLSSVVESVHEAGASASRDRSGPSWRNHVLWVDDRPSNNIYERQAFEAMGIKFKLALATEDALAELRNGRVGAIISDMGRNEGPREGYVLLERLRDSGDQTPFFIYAGSNALEHRREASERGAQGSTNDPEELFRTVTRALLRG